MKTTLCLVLALTMTFKLVADDGHRAKKELNALAGTWKAITMEAQGRALPKNQIPDFRFIVESNGKSTSKSPFGDYQSTITVDPEKSPPTIDNLHETGAQQGQSQYGVYKLDGDTWTVCMSPPGASKANRPKDFKTAGTPNAVFTFQRQTEAKQP